MGSTGQNDKYKEEFEILDRGISFELVEWHIRENPTRRIHASSLWYKTKEEAENILKASTMKVIPHWLPNQMPSSTWKKCHQGGMVSQYGKDYTATLKDQFQTKKDYLRYICLVSAHPSKARKELDEGR